MTRDETEVCIRKCVEWWQERLYLRDLAVNLLYDDSPDETWLSVNMDHGQEDPNTAYIKYRSYTSGGTVRDIWEAVAHELSHVLQWPLYFCLHKSRLGKLFSTHQQEIINDVQHGGYETVAYKLERILVNAFEYPGDEVLTGNVDG